MEDEHQNKRPAYAGQWRTPPTPIFPTSTSASNNNNNNTNNNQHHHGADAASHAPITAAPAATTATPNPLQTLPERLPVSTEDYVKALEEAYLRGARAAAAMAQQPATAPSAANTAPVPPPVPVVVAPPPPPAPMVTSAPPVAAAINSSAAAATTTVTTPAAAAPTVVTAAATDTRTAANAADTTANMSTVASCPDLANIQPTPVVVSAPPPPPAVMPHHPGLSLSASSVPNPLLNAPPPAMVTSAPGVAAQPSQQQQQHMQQQQQQQSQQQHRSMSLPDMSAYAQEEAKRQKRLARNRASARLRRLRKKNLVDAYEAEVTHLERTLQLLQQHVWGGPLPGHTGQAAAQQETNIVLEALQMERGQQELTQPERQQAAAQILSQQLQAVEQLQLLEQEQFLLYQLAASTTATNKASPPDAATEPDDALLHELQQVLQLSPAQVEALQQEATSWYDEYQALTTVQESLQAMKENQWLWNNGIATMVQDNFMNLLHRPQVSKFLLWSDANWDAIDELDMVSCTSGAGAHTVFQFGVDSLPSEDKHQQ